MLNIAPGLQLDPDVVGGWTLGVLAKKGAGKSYTARVLAEEFFDAGIPFVAIDPMGAMTGLRSSADGKRDGLPIVIFGGDQGDVPLEPTAGAVLADLVAEDRVSMVLDLSAFGERALERKFARAFFERLYRRNRELVHLLVDEADLFAPQKPQSGDQPLLGVMENIVRRGRNRGIGCTLISQRPAVLNKDVLTQIDLLVALRITSPQDRKALGEWVKGHDESDQGATMLGSLAGLANGESWWWAPELDLFRRVQVRQARTFDSSPTRTRAGRRVQPTIRADVDLDAVRERMAATIEKAKAEDPRELRKQIATLQRELAQARDAATVEVQVERVEVPVLPDGHADALRAVHEVLDRAVHDAMEARARLGHLAEDAESVPSRTAQELATEIRAPVSRTETRKQPTHRVERMRETERGLEADFVPAAPSGNGTLSGLKRQIVEAMAAYPDRDLTVEQLALMTGKSPKGGYFRNMLGQLRTEGYVAGMRVTQQGVDAVGDVRPPDRDAVLAMWREKLGGGVPRDIFDLVVEAYPRGVTDEELATALDKELRGGYFRNMLGKVRGAGLMVKRGSENVLNEALIPPV